MTKSGQTGFTIVELIIVIIVIGILATLTSVAYISSQKQASDARIRDAADKFSDAIQLWSAQNGGAQPKGGFGSTVAANATTGCVDGSQGFQDYLYVNRDPNYKCTVGDAMVATGYLTADLFNSLPKSSVFNVTNMIFTIYPCWNNSKQMILMYNLQVPSASDTANINSILTACGADPATSPWTNSYGMRGATLIRFP